MFGRTLPSCQYNLVNTESADLTTTWQHCRTIYYLARDQRGAHYRTIYFLPSLLHPFWSAQSENIIALSLSTPEQRVPIL